MSGSNQVCERTHRAGSLQSFVPVAGTSPLSCCPPGLSAHGAVAIDDSSRSCSWIKFSCPLATESRCLAARRMAHRERDPMKAPLRLAGRTRPVLQTGTAAGDRPSKTLDDIRLPSALSLLPRAGALHHGPEASWPKAPTTILDQRDLPADQEKCRASENPSTRGGTLSPSWSKFLKSLPAEKRRNHVLSPVRVGLPIRLQLHDR